MALILAAAQIRFQLETLTAAETRIKEVEDQRESGGDSCSPLFFVPPVVSISSKVPNLANELFVREVSDWKERYEKASHTLRTKDLQLKTNAEEAVKLQQLSNDLRRDLKKSNADSKSNERFLKCVQAEYELLRSISGKSNEAVNDMKEEASRLTKTNEELTRIINFQGHEIKTKIAENENKCREKKALELSVISHLESATAAAAKAEKAALLLDSAEEKNQRLEQRLASLLEQLQQERSLNRSYRTAASEAEAAASSSSVSLVEAATLHSELIQRLNDRDREIASLKAALENAAQASEAALSAQDGSQVRSSGGESAVAATGSLKRARCDGGSNATIATEAPVAAPVAVAGVAGVAGVAAAVAPTPTPGLRETSDRDSGTGSATASMGRSAQVPEPAPAPVPAPLSAGEEPGAAALGQSRRTAYGARAEGNNGGCPICLESPYGLMVSLPFTFHFLSPCRTCRRINTPASLLPCPLLT
jgi:hypothetical protein